MRRRARLIITLMFTVLLVNAQNVTDAAGLKQGLWKLTIKDKKLPGYAEGQIIEEGFYLNNKKDGIWKKFYPNNRLEHELTFVKGKLEGKAVFYYKNGKKREEGIWKRNRWVGEYKYYYKNGNLRNEWKYNETGKRTGVQRYYHENGKVKIEGAWENGKESGPLIEFYNDGSVKSERFFSGGKIDPGKTKQYKKSEKTTPSNVVSAKPGGSTKPAIKVDSAQAGGTAALKPKPKPEAKASPFNGTGYHEFLDKQGRVIKKGNFVNGFLRNGEMYKYSSEGKLIKTTVYKNGKKIREINH